MKDSPELSQHFEQSCKAEKTAITIRDQSLWPGRLTAQPCVQICKCQRASAGFCQPMTAFYLEMGNSIQS